MGKIKSFILKIYDFLVLFEKKLSVFLQIGILSLLPVKKNRIVFSSFCGENYSCNPRAIFEYLYSNYGKKFEYVWLFDYNKNPIIPEELKQKAKCVQFNSFESSYYKATAGVWCFNHRNTKYFKKKKNQLYIQTWHGDIGFKSIDEKLYKIGCLSEGYAQKCRTDSAMTDILISGSDWGYNNLREAFFYDKGEIVKYGCPRNDVLINHSKDYLYEEIRNKYKLSPTCKICLFAPTFRKTFDIADSFVSDKEKRDAFIRALESRFGGEWVLMVKYHPASIAKNKEYILLDGENLVDVSKHGDVAELLVAADALISDYSSISFDFALTKKPCWLYFEDFEQYAKDDCEIAIDIDQVLFKKCLSAESLIKAVTEHNNEKYQENIDKMLLSFGSYEQGFSCKKIAERIISFIN